LVRVVCTPHGYLHDVVPKLSSPEPARRFAAQHRDDDDSFRTALSQIWSATVATYVDGLAGLPIFPNNGSCGSEVAVLPGRTTVPISTVTFLSQARRWAPKLKAKLNN
jgi:hypothetical protein